MKKSLFVLLVFQMCAFAVDDKYAPLPEKIVNAKTVFITNETGKAKLGDALYQQVKTWNRWEVVTEREKADLVLSLADHSGVGKLNPAWYLNVLDPQSKEILWTSRTTMQGKLWRSWGSVAQTLVGDIRKRLK